MKRKGGSNVGDFDEVSADEDTDRDVEIAEGVRVERAGKTARQRIEELREEKE